MPRLAILTLLMCILSRSGASAQTASSPSGQFRSGVVLYEKFFQTPDDGPREDVWAGLMEIRLEDPMPVDERVRFYTRLELLQYRQLGSSPGALLGVRRRGRTHMFDAYGLVQWNRPRSDIGDELEKADHLGGGGSYTYRVFAGLHLTGRGEYKEEFLKPERITGSRFREFGGIASYRLLSGKLVPEAGFYEGQRTTGSASGAYVQETTAVGIRMPAAPRTLLNIRYRQRVREYAIRPGTTVARVDRREQVGADLDISAVGNLVLNLWSAVERGQSTRGSGFVARTFGAGFSVVY
jgi:hypothetical protein